MPAADYCIHLDDFSVFYESRMFFRQCEYGGVYYYSSSKPVGIDMLEFTITNDSVSKYLPIILYDLIFAPNTYQIVKVSNKQNLASPQLYFPGVFNLSKF